MLTTKACDEEEKGNGGKERNYSGLIMRESCLLVFACGLCSPRARLGCNEERKRKEVNLLEESKNRRTEEEVNYAALCRTMDLWIFGFAFEGIEQVKRKVTKKSIVRLTSFLCCFLNLLLIVGEPFFHLV